jgi:hypothetical protein
LPGPASQVPEARPPAQNAPGGQADDGGFSNAVGWTVKLSQKVVGRLLGCLLANLIGKGMTTQEVDAILGDDPLRCNSAFAAGTVNCMWLRYHTYGITVSFTNDSDRVMRVERVSFLPLFH